MTLVPRIVDLLAEQGADDVAVFCGGTIPKGDVEKLKELGVGEVFTPGTPTTRAVEYIQEAIPARQG